MTTSMAILSFLGVTKVFNMFITGCLRVYGYFTALI